MQANRPVVLINDPTVLVRSMWSSTLYKFFFFVKKRAMCKRVTQTHRWKCFVMGKSQANSSIRSSKLPMH